MMPLKTLEISKLVETGETFRKCTELNRGVRGILKSVNSTEEQRMIEKPVNRGDKKKIGRANRLENTANVLTRGKFMKKSRLEQGSNHGAT